MLKTRVLSGIVLVVVIAALFITGGAVMATALLGISFIGLYEFYRAVGLLADGRKCDLLTGAGYLGTIVLYIICFLKGTDTVYVILVVAVVMVVMLGVFVFTFPRYEAKNVAFAFFGFCYAPLLLSFLYLTRSLPDGVYIVWLILISSWVCDTFAYFTGMLFGKHRLAPVLSPKKSIEGAIGGVVFAALAGGLYGFAIRNYIVSDLSVIPAFVTVCAVGAVVSQVGDLAASGIKRNFDIKDYGHLIPGHGGILDRFDSTIFAAPMVYLVALFFTNI